MTLLTAQQCGQALANYALQLRGEPYSGDARVRVLLFHHPKDPLHELEQARVEITFDTDNQG